MDLSVGMYVRTEYGISKIINIFPEKRATFIETDNGLGNCSVSGVSLPRGLHKGIYLLEENYEMFIENNVKKTIIELIQVGDYVNGWRVNKIEKKEDGVMLTIGTITSFVSKNEKEPYLTHDYDEPDKICKLKSIVTKEQFESMSYKVGE